VDFTRLDGVLLTNAYILRHKNSTNQEKLQLSAPSQVKKLVTMLLLSMVLRLQDNAASLGH
jgi:hypothetical protein